MLYPIELWVRGAEGCSPGPGGCQGRLRAHERGARAAWTRAAAGLTSVHGRHRPTAAPDPTGRPLAGAARGPPGPFGALEAAPQGRLERARGPHGGHALLPRLA